jgi:hypothetical protein
MRTKYYVANINSVHLYSCYCVVHYENVKEVLVMCKSERKNGLDQPKQYMTFYAKF